MRGIRRAARARAAGLTLALLLSAGMAHALVVPHGGGGKARTHAGQAAAEHLRPDPALLRSPPSPPAHESARGDPDADAGTAWFVLWPAAQHVQVRRSDAFQRDPGARARLEAEVARPVDPDRVRLASLVDDVLTDDALAAVLRRRPEAAAHDFVGSLRTAAQPIAFSRLVALLEPMRGDVLMLAFHVDPVSGSAVFRGADGRARSLALRTLQQAAQQAGVDLRHMGCGSGRHVATGFRDAVNSLDVVRAMARVIDGRPRSAFELMQAISSETMVLTIDPDQPLGGQAIAVTSAPGGPQVSTLYWGEARPAPLVRPPQAPPGQPTVAPPAAWWPALAGLAAVVVLSVLAWQVLDWRLASTWTDRGVWMAFDFLAHVALLPLLLSILAAAVDGAAAAAWAWGMVAMLAIPVAIVLPQALRRRASPGWRIAALRIVLFAWPFFAIAWLRADGPTLPEPAMVGLRGLYLLGRMLPTPDLMILITFLAPAGLLLLGKLLLLPLAMLYLAVRALLWPFVAIRDALRERRTSRARSAQLDEQLAAAGLPAGAARRSALRARRELDEELSALFGEQPVPWQLLADRHDFIGPDPWAGITERPWALRALPLHGDGDGDGGAAVHGLMRPRSPFIHPLPHAFVARWQRGELRAEDLPVLLARTERRLRRGDFLEREIDAPAALPAGLLCAVGAGAILAAAERTLVSLHDPGVALALGSLAATAGWVLGGMLRRRRHRAWLRRVSLPPPLDRHATMHAPALAPPPAGPGTTAAAQAPPAPSA